MRGHARVVQVESNIGVAPPAWAEMAYYVLTVYAIMSTAWGINVGMLGASMLGILALLCTLHLGSRAGAVHNALVLPVLCGLTHLAIQVVIYGESALGETLRPFVTWMLSLLIVQALALRPGFLHRFGLIAFAVGLLVLPYMQFTPSGPDVYRAGLDARVGISNPNDLGAWLGFCCIYFIVLGLETQRLTVRVTSWVFAAVSLLIVGLTVSRGPLLSIGVATVIALRRTLKHGFFPVVALFVGLWVAYALGVFDQTMGYYMARGTADTGRVAVGPLAFGRFLNSPFVGVGASHIATWVPAEEDFISPHDSFLFFPVVSGILPAFLFCAYLGRAAWRTVFCQAHPELRADQPFRLPLLVYLVLSCTTLDYPFMSPWGIVTACIAMSAVLSRPMGRARHFTNGESQSPRQREYAVMT